jgi:hypothetical protein
MINFLTEPRRPFPLSCLCRFLFDLAGLFLGAAGVTATRAGTVVRRKREASWAISAKQTRRVCLHEACRTASSDPHVDYQKMAFLQIFWPVYLAPALLLASLVRHSIVTRARCRIEKAAVVGRWRVGTRR